VDIIWTTTYSSLVLSLFLVGNVVVDALRKRTKMQVFVVIKTDLDEICVTPELIGVYADEDSATGAADENIKSSFGGDGEFSGWARFDDELVREHESELHVYQVITREVGE
jgi:hypothetical protein